MATAETPSVTDRARLIAAGAPVVGAYFLKHTPVFVLGDEALLFAAGDGEPKRVAVHGGGTMAAACDGERIVTDGADGKVAATTADTMNAVIATDQKDRWID